MNNNMNAKIQGYKTFGMRQEWLDEFLIDPEYFWTSNTLGTAQVDGFKAWLKDSEITDAKNQLTSLGEFIRINKDDEPDLIWEIILTNLTYNSFIFNWFSHNVKVGQAYDRRSLLDLIIELGYEDRKTTVENAVAAFIQTCDYSPIGNVMNYASQVNDRLVTRGSYPELSLAGLAYCLYKYAEKRSVRSLRVSDFYQTDSEGGPAKIFGIERSQFESILKSLNSMDNRVLIAELNMGLDSITLRDDLNPLTCLQTLIA